MTLDELRRRASACLRAASRSIATAFRGQYVRTLEEEVVRLHAENRALINSILGVAGIPPMRAAVAAQSTNVRVLVGATLGSPRRGKPRPYEEAASNTHASVTSAPLRRRSWQQIGRALEIEDARAARREREVNTETFPPPRQLVVRDS